MALPLLGALANPQMALGALSAGGSILGGLMQGDSAEDAMNLQKSMGTKTLLDQYNALNRADKLTQPIIDATLSSFPYLQYMATGIAPEQATFGGDLERELADLRAREGDMMARRNQLSSSTTGNRKNQKRYAAEINDIDRQLSRMRELQGMQQKAQAYQAFQGGDFRRDYGEMDALDRMRNFNADYGERGALESLRGLDPNISVDLENDPIYQAQKAEMLRTLNRRMASGGKYASSDADNALTRNILPFMQDAYGRGIDTYNRRYGSLVDQFNMGGQMTQRDYGRLTDRFNMGNALTNRQYGQQLDLAKIGTGASAAAGNQLVGSTNAIATNTMNTAGNIGAGMQQKGNIMGNLVSNVASAPLQMYTTNRYLNALGG